MPNPPKLDGREKKEIRKSTFADLQTYTAEETNRGNAFDNLTKAEKKKVPKMYISRLELLAVLGVTDTEPGSAVKGVNFRFAADLGTSTFIMTISGADEEMGNVADYKAYRNDDPDLIEDSDETDPLYDKFRREGKQMYLSRFQGRHMFTKPQLLKVLFNNPPASNEEECNFEAVLDVLQGKYYYRVVFDKDMVPANNELKISYYSCPPTCYD